MKQSELIQLIGSPQNSVYSDVHKLENLAKEFPFFQSARMLLTLTSKKHNSSLYQQTLKHTAISIPNRSRLYHLLNFMDTAVQKEETDVKQTEKPVAEVKSKQEIAEIDHLKAIELHTEKVSEEELTRQVEKEVEKQIVSALVEKQILQKGEPKKEEAKKEEEKAAEVKKEAIQSGSFGDWLKALKEEKQIVKTGEAGEKEEKRVDETPKQDVQKKLQQKSIIDKVIESNPGNIRLKTDQKFYAAENKAKESLFENEDLVTETLAKIYALQGNTSKAIRAYEILSLKFPQKSAYFATLIENLKKNK